jgi:hypothetical protein
MTTETRIVFTREDVRKILQNYYNITQNQNHELGYVHTHVKEVDDTVALKITMWNRDEEIH